MSSSMRCHRRPAPRSDALNASAGGLTVADVARRYRVSPDKVRAWIARGELVAVNTARALCGKPRWVVPPEALAVFEHRRTGGPVPKPARRKRKATGFIDYYPDAKGTSAAAEAGEVRQ